MILILPLVLGLTAFADHPLRVNALLYFMAGFCYTLAPKQSHASTRAASRGFRVSSLSSSDISKTSETSDNGYMPLADVESEEEKQPVSSSVQLPRSVFYKPFVTVWRAHMMIMTIICILAVDFPIFPRSFGKCETWGTSIVCRQEVRCRSFLKFPKDGFRSRLLRLCTGLRHGFAFLAEPTDLKWFCSFSSMLQAKFERACPWTRPGAHGQGSRVSSKCCPISITLKSSDLQQEHVTEYGVHWNFFFTLGLVPVFGVLAENCWPRLSFRTMALLVTASKHLKLPFAGRRAHMLHRSPISAHNHTVTSFHYRRSPSEPPCTKQRGSRQFCGIPGDLSIWPGHRVV